MLHLNVPLEKRGDMVDFDELVAWPGRGTHIALGRVIHEIKSGWAPPSLHVDLFRAQDCEPAIYTRHGSWRTRPQSLKSSKSIGLRA